MRKQHIVLLWIVFCGFYVLFRLFIASRFCSFTQFIPGANEGLGRPDPPILWHKFSSPMRLHCVMLAKSRSRPLQKFWISSCILPLNSIFKIEGGIGVRREWVGWMVWVGGWDGLLGWVVSGHVEYVGKINNIIFLFTKFDFTRIELVVCTLANGVSSIINEFCIEPY